MSEQMRRVNNHRNSDNQMDRNQRRKRRAQKKVILAALFAIVFILGIMLGSGLVTTKADAQDVSSMEYKYYTSVFVRDGDSLWSIAQEYMDDDYDNENQYIDEVKQINNLSDDNLQAGSFICVPYYSQEIK